MKKILFDTAITAEKAECDEMVTYNVQDFQRVWPLTSANLVEP